MTFHIIIEKIHISMITCMKMKSFILKYASKIMFYDVNIACYQVPPINVQPTHFMGSNLNSLQSGGLTPFSKH